MTRYYDVVLGLIPASLLGISGLLYGLGVSMTAAVPLAAVVAAGIVAHAMFVRAPVDAPDVASTANSNARSDAQSVQAAD